MKYQNAFLAWLPLAVAITGLCGLVYATVQQNYRQSLNDPQIQMAEDAARILSEGGTPASVVPQDKKIDIAQSLSPWIAVYDQSDMPLESSGIINGAVPRLPKGVFDQAFGSLGKDTVITGQNRVTWQPEENVRSAIVVQHVTGKFSGFVVVGRNMREVEKREGRLSLMVSLAWVLLIFTTILAQLVGAALRR